MIVSMAGTGWARSRLLELNGSSGISVFATCVHPLSPRSRAAQPSRECANLSTDSGTGIAAVAVGCAQRFAVTHRHRHDAGPHPGFNIFGWVFGPAGTDLERPVGVGDRQPQRHGRRQLLARAGPEFGHPPRYERVGQALQITHLLGRRECARTSRTPRHCGSGTTTRTRCAPPRRRQAWSPTPPRRAPEPSARNHGEPVDPWITRSSPMRAKPVGKTTG